MTPEPISDDDLQAYADGALSPDRRRDVEAHLAADRVAAERVAAYRGQNDLLHTLYDPVLDEPVPARLRPGVSVGRGRWPGRAAAASLLLLAGGLVGWWLHGVGPGSVLAPGQDLARRAAAAHAVFTPEVRHPVEVSAAEERHLVGWLSKRLKAHLKAPVLTANGFNLVGGRLLTDGRRPAGLFMYEDERGRRLTLYVRRRQGGAGETAFRFSHEDGIGVMYWIDSELSYAIAGELDRESLLTLSRPIYDQLEDISVPNHPQ